MNDAQPAPVWVRLAAAIIRHMPAGRYRALNRMCRATRAAFWMRAPKELGGWSFCCDLRDSIAREVCFTGRYEPQETALVQAILRPGMSFVDVGANWGYFTLLAAHQVGKAGRVVSLEPDPRLFPLLAENIAANRLSHVSALPLAAACEQGWLALAGFEETQGNFGLSRLIGQNHVHGPLFQVAARPLDAVLQDVGVANVDLLKMDIEGAEGLALSGLRESLANRRVQRLLVELHPAHLAEHGQNPSDLNEKLRQFDYVAWKIDHSERANRWAAYQSYIDLRRVVRPLEDAAPLDRWPHVLWVLRGKEPV